MNLLMYLNNKEWIKGVNILYVVNYYVLIYICYWLIFIMFVIFDK